MGVVFRARDLYLDRNLAVKVLLQPTPSQMRRFRREGCALARLRHPNIVLVHGMGETPDGQVYLAMDLVEGGTLAERVRTRGPLPSAEVAVLGRKLADALATSHAEGILHRDLKPSNVLLDLRGEPRLTDFGLAKDAHEVRASSGTLEGTALGTPSYWSPEQAQGAPDAIGPATDVYGLGATLYTALTGEPPVTGNTLWEIMVATADVKPTPPSELQPGVDPALEEVILRCLEKDPGDRYLDAAALRDALEAVVRARPWGRRSAAFGALLATVLLLSGVGVALGVRGQPAPPDPATATPALPPPDAPPESTPADTTPGPSDPEPKPGPATPPARPEAPPQAPQPPGPKPTPAAHEAMTKAEALLAAGDPRQAEAIASRIIEAVPDAAYAFQVRGAARLNLGNPSSAYADARRCTELDPQSPSGWVLYATACASLNRWEEVLEILERAEATGAGREDVLYLRGRALTLLGRWPEALEVTSALVGIREDPIHLQDRGRARGQLGNLEGALEDFERAYELGGPILWQANLEGAIFLRAAGRTQEVVDWATRALKHAPSDRAAEILRLRSEALLRLDDGEGALRDYDGILRLSPRDVTTLCNRAALLLANDVLSRASQDIARVLAVDPGHAVARLMRAKVREQEGDLAGALEDLEWALPRLTDTGRRRIARESLARVRARLKAPQQ
jgi:tetratricopeptide (TPR) repeat protein